MVGELDEPRYRWNYTAILISRESGLRHSRLKLEIGLRQPQDAPSLPESLTERLGIRIRPPPATVVLELRPRHRAVFSPNRPLETTKWLAPIGRTAQVEGRPSGSYRAILRATPIAPDTNRAPASVLISGTSPSQNL
jgi:hypothetical protein